MARTKNQGARRAQLITAAAQTILERGATETRLRDIAAEAGLTPTSVLYYYPDVRELFTAVFEQGMQTYCRRREESINQAVGAWDQLDACIHSGVPRPGETEDTSRLLVTLAPVALRDETALALQRDFLANQVVLYQRILQVGQDEGTFQLTAPAAQLARDFVALEDGYVLSVLTGTQTADEVEQRLRQHARLVTTTA